MRDFPRLLEAEKNLFLRSSLRRIRSFQRFFRTRWRCDIFLGLSATGDGKAIAQVPQTDMNKAPESLEGDTWVFSKIPVSYTITNTIFERRRTCLLLGGATGA